MKVVRLHLKCKERVIHKKFGVGIVLCEWGQIVGRDVSTSGAVGGEGTYDVMFKKNGKWFLHCCNEIYLKRQ